MIESVRVDGRTPVPIGPAAPDIAGDGIAWHEMAALAPTTVRRCQRIDAFGPQTHAGQMCVQQYFRDSHAGVDGETVMHEYLVDAAFVATDNSSRSTSALASFRGGRVPARRRALSDLLACRSPVSRRACGAI